MNMNSLYDPFAIHFDSFAGDVYTLDTASLTLTAGTLTADTITDGTASLTGGNLSGADLDISAGTGTYLSSGSITGGAITANGLLLADNTTTQLRLYYDGGAKVLDITLDVNGDVNFILGNGGTYIFDDDLTIFGILTANTNTINFGSDSSPNDTVVNFLSSGNDGSMTYDQTDNEFDFGNAQILTTGTLGSGAITSTGALVLNTVGTISTDQVALSINDNTLITGTGTNAALRINQGADSLGLQIYGFDDHNTKHIAMYVNANGIAQINSPTEWNFLFNESTRLAIREFQIRCFVDFDMQDNILVGFGADRDLGLGWNETAQELQLVAGSTIGTNVRFTVDTSGNFKFGTPATNYLGVGATGNLGFNGSAEVETNMPFADTKFLVMDKASGNGIKVDTASPTYGFADIIGDQFSKNTGASKPTLTTYNGAIEAWQFGTNDEAFISYHIPHDYVAGTDLHLHIHWSQNAAGATGGDVDFRYTAIYAKGHNQVSGSTFTSTPITDTFSSIDINDGDSGLDQYQQHLTEVTISAATATAALFDRDDFEPDGVIELTFEMVASNLTGTPSLPFIHFVDIHYSTTNLIGTKAKAPNFYV